MIEDIATEFIVEPGKDQRFWVVRCERGLFFDHFLKYGVVGIGHLDHLVQKSCPSMELDTEYGVLYSRAESSFVEPNYKSAQRRAALSQIRTFIEEMAPGDLVMTARSGELMVGRILSHPEIDHSTLEVQYDVGKPHARMVPMRMFLRRRVEWGPRILRREFPFNLRKALGAHLTVFSIDDYWRELYHLLYPVFRKGSQLYFGLGINQQGGIQNLHIYPLFAFLTDVEALARTADGANIAAGQNVDLLVDKLDRQNRLNLETKAQFMSPGEIWGALSGLDLKHMGYFYLIYSAVFGSTKLGWTGFVDPKAVGREAAKVVDLAKAQWKLRHGEKVADKLKLNPPMTETRALRDASNDEPSRTEAKIVGKKRAKASKAGS